MKNAKILITLALALFILCGCTPAQENVSATGNSEVLSHMPSSPQFQVWSSSDFEAILNADKMTDVQVKEFIKQHKIPTSSTEKNTVTTFSEILRTVGYPTVNFRVNYGDFRVSLFPDSWDYTIIYYISDVTYRFDYDAAGEFVDVSKYPEAENAGICEIDGIQFPLYHVYQMDQEGFVGFIHANGYRIRVSAYQFEDASKVSFEPFSWSTDMKLAD